MPLLSRIPDHHSVGEFRRAARLRFAEARRAAEADDRLIGIYLAGYAAEMTLKAAYFRVDGKKPTDLIRMTDLYTARDRYKVLFGSKWPGSLRNLIAWLELLVGERQSRGIPYPAGLLGELSGQVQRVAANWSEVLRYHENRPRPDEIIKTFQAVDWLIANGSRLAR